jgi:hypothetical protein
VDVGEPHALRLLLVRRCPAPIRIELLGILVAKVDGLGRHGNEVVTADGGVRGLGGQGGAAGAAVG